MKLEVTKAQLSAIVRITDDISSMIGGGEDDTQWEKDVKFVDRMLKKNGYKRNYS